MADCAGPSNIDQRLTSTSLLMPPVLGAQLASASFRTLCCAHGRPSLVLARIRCLSNSARPPKTVSINRPCGVVVSAQASPNDLERAPASAIAARVLSKSLVERASLSNLQTTSVSPLPSPPIAFDPLTTSSPQPVEHLGFGRQCSPAHSPRSLIGPHFRT